MARVLKDQPNIRIAPKPDKPVSVDARPAFVSPVPQALSPMKGYTNIVNKNRQKFANEEAKFQMALATASLEI